MTTLAGHSISLKTVRKVQMFDYIKKLLAELPKDRNRVANTPAAKHLFQINETPVHLYEVMTIMFHHNVANYYFRQVRMTRHADQMWCSLQHG